jgi:hypothetical protein
MLSVNLSWTDPSQAMLEYQALKAEHTQARARRSRSVSARVPFSHPGGPLTPTPRDFTFPCELLLQRCCSCLMVLSP